MNALSRLAALLLVLTVLPASGESFTMPKDVLINDVEFVLIPAGEFWYSVGNGDPDSHARNSPRFREVRVWLDDFYLAKYEARASDLERFMNSGRPAETPPQVTDAAGKVCSIEALPGGGFGLPEPFRSQANRPAGNISWTVANAFAGWMGFRLPTEAEWEKAARGPSDRRIWPWGNTYPDDTFGHFAFGAALCHPAGVNAYPKGQSPYGIFNMAGNVAEWVADWYSLEFDAALQDGARNPPTAATGSVLPGMPGPARIEKGGRWGASPEGLAIAGRATLIPDYYNPLTGVRFALDAAVVRRHLEAGTAATIK